MNFVSTRGRAAAVSIGQAIRAGAAPDGGLYMPAEPVRLDPGRIGPGLSLPQLAHVILAPFFKGDALALQLGAICDEALDISAPLVAPDPARLGFHVLELFHGPTGAFKDFGARFLMSCLSRLSEADRPLNVLVATSGDTGGAVGAAAEGRDNLRTFILYPRGRISPFQAHQLGCWGPPVTALEVDGDFDDCQRLVKAAFRDPALARHKLSSANSINIGRLLPQMVYFASAALRLREETGIEPGFLIPTGNLGHALAALLARSMGLPIGPIVAVTNANRALSDWDRTRVYKPRPSVRTIANAMDVGSPSNFERLVWLPAAERQCAVQRISDDQIRERIRRDHETCGYVWCPHSATAADAYTRLSDTRRKERSWVAVATAHPFKFAPVVEPLIGRPVEPTPALAAAARRESRHASIASSLAALGLVLTRPEGVGPAQ